MSEVPSRRQSADTQPDSQPTSHLPPLAYRLPPLSRRDVLKSLSALGIGTVTFQRALAAKAVEVGMVTAEMVREAEWIASLELTDEERERTCRRLTDTLAQYALLREIPLPEDTPPALGFDPTPGGTMSDATVARECGLTSSAPVQRPDSDEELAFLPVTKLSQLIRTGQITSTELTKLYLARLKKYDPLLKCVVTLTEELALQQAAEADREIKAGRYRGLLHGIPWGAKDLIAYPGYPTTWGAPQYKNRVLDAKASVAQRLDEAGAVLVAKLSLGALAQGDRWYGGPTRNPWNPEEGSSGSSAGSASAVAAGLVGFAIGSETLGSIVSPCRRCGCAGLRPTFGRVSRAGCMSLAWSMDKIGPIARTAEDCAIVFAQIHGADGQDATTVNRPFHWPVRRPLSSLRVGYFAQQQTPGLEQTLAALRQLGVTLVEFELPESIPAGAVSNLLDVEAAAAFDEWTRAGITEGLNTWPEVFREGQFIPAVEYLRANRLRTLMMRQMQEAMRDIDVYVEGNDLALTNLTGHPSVIVPHYAVQTGPTRRPATIKFTGKLFGEEELLLLASAYQSLFTEPLRPPLDKFMTP